MSTKLEELKKELHDAIEALKTKAEGSSEKQEALEQAVQNLQAKIEELEKERKTVPEPDGEIQTKQILSRPATNEFERKVQEINDDLVLCAQVLGKKPNETKLYQHYKEMYPAEMKALSSSSGSGGEFIPTGYSPRIFEEIRVALKVAGLHEHINMPSNPYQFPVTFADSEGYLVTEASGDTPGYNVPATGFTTGDFTLTARKLGARVRFSEELNEDSIVPVIGVVRSQIVKAIAAAIENAIINGDTAGTHMDSDVTSASDARKAWDGYRKLAPSAAKVDGGGDALSWDEVVSLRAKLGKYGLNPNELAWVTSLTCYLKDLINLKDSAGNMMVVTVDKYGPQATVLNGELGKLMGSPIIVSEYVREDLNNSGVYDGSTTDKTLFIGVNRNQFYVGVRRELVVKTGVDIESDQQIIVATTRLAFGTPFSTYSVVGLVYDIAP